MKKSLLIILAILLVSGCMPVEPDAIYIDNARGNDANPGTAFRPVKTIGELNLRLQSRPSVIFFTGDQVYKGTLVLNGLHGNSKKIKITSTSRKRATIDGGNNEAIRAENCSGLIISGLRLKGAGRKDGNTTNGLSLVKTSDSRIEYVRAEGFQKSGINLHNCHDIVLRGNNAFNNGFAGINVIGSSRDSSRNIVIMECNAENNPGDPSKLDNHSGNGILAGVSDNIKIIRCTATNNGWDMPRKGNGPVGIWAWECSNVKIKYCISYWNKTSEGAKDGGGFDLDGGVTNSVVQNCLSFGNEGAGFGLFQYAGASGWANNKIRYNISINDATTTGGAGSIFIWNGSRERSQLSGCSIERNVIMNFKTPLISYENDSEHENFEFYGNLFIGRDTISGINKGSRFSGNIWIGRKRK